MEQRDAWRLYFMTAVGWQMHPGYQLKTAEDHLTMIRKAASLADELLNTENDTWDGWQQQQSREA